MKTTPPKWADRFLQWYCRPDLLEEIQGDVYELFYRATHKNKTKANLLFIWNVLRFFRWKNIRKTNPSTNHTLSSAMLKNIFKVAIRNFRRYPGHSFLTVVGLSVSFVCAFLIMLWIAHESSFDRFHSSSDRLYKVITHVNANGTFQTYDVAGHNINTESLAEVENTTSVSSGSRWPHELCFRAEGKPNDCVYFNGIYASENFFNTFSFSINQGNPNPLTKSTDLAISEKMARALYGNENPVGKTMQLDGWIDVTVVSVFKDTPTNSSLQFDFVLPYAVLKRQWGIKDDMLAQQFFSIYLKTHQPTSTALLTEKLNDTQVIGEAYKKQQIQYEAVAMPDWHLNSTYEGGKNTGGRIEYVYLFTIIGSLIVLMAVINFINMTTARATLRAKEIGIRKVTGAVRGMLLVQFLGESFIVVLLAFVLAGIGAQLALPAFNQLVGETHSLDLLSGPVPVYLVAFLLVVALLAGTYPALVLSGFRPALILKGNFGSTTGSLNLRKVLITLQLTISICIITFSGVIYSQLNFISNKNIGFDHKNTLRIEPTFKLLKSYDLLSNDLLQHPAIQAMSAADINPLNAGGGNVGVDWPGKSPDTRIAFKTIGCIYGFPETLGLQVLEGRSFGPQPALVDSLTTEVLITSQAASLMGLTEPVGSRIKVGPVQCEVIGVVNDFHTASLRQSMEPVIIYRKAIEHISAIYVRYQPGKAKEALEAVTTAYKKIEPSFTMKYWFQDETFDELYKTEAVISRLSAVFTVVALVIAIIGMAGLATFHALRKTKEIGIRRVFGASALQALRVLIAEFKVVLLAAITIAVPIAWFAATNWLEKFAYRIDLPWWIFILATGGTALLIMAIVWIQGHRTIYTNPTTVLRHE